MKSFPNEILTSTESCLSSRTRSLLERLQWKRDRMPSWSWRMSRFLIIATNTNIIVLTFLSSSWTYFDGWTSRCSLRTWAGARQTWTRRTWGGTSWWLTMALMTTTTMMMMMKRTIMPNIENLRLGREKADLGSHLQEMEEELQVWIWKNHEKKKQSVRKQNTNRKYEPRFPCSVTGCDEEIQGISVCCNNWPDHNSGKKNIMGCGNDDNDDDSGYEDDDFSLVM